MLVHVALIMVIVFMGFRIFNHIRYDVWSDLNYSFFGGKEREKIEQRKRDKKYAKRWAKEQKRNR